MGYRLRGFGGCILGALAKMGGHPPRALRIEEAFIKSLNSRRTLLTAVFGAALLSVAGSALAAGGQGPAEAKVVVKGSESVVPNAYLKIGFHFDPGMVPIRSGGTVTLTNTTMDGHTL